VRIANVFSISIILLALAGLGPAQQTDNNNKPSATFGNDRPKSQKESNTRTIQGVVKDASDNPVEAIVQLKDTKTAKIVSFPTKDDGKFAFRDLAMDSNYELLAKRGEITTPVKKVSVYDTRKSVVVNFQLTAAAQPQ
jgi:hypothetical protein